MLQRSRNALRLLIPLPALLATLWIGGCGFQPRGQALQTEGIPEPIHVSGLAPHSALHQALDMQLDAAGVTRTSDVAQAAARLDISDQRSESRVLSVDSRNKAVEFELAESAGFALRTADRPDAPVQKVQVVRILYQPQDALLGSRREAELLRADMYRELAGRIVRRLAASP